MRKSILFVVLATLGATSAYAVEPEANGFYLGGVAGFTRLDDDNFAEDFGLGSKKSSGAIGINGGYKFLRYLSVEGRFQYLGKFEVFDKIGSAEAYVKPTVLTANVVGILPLGSNGWELFGQLGLGGVFFNDNLSSAGQESLDTEALGTAGVGIRAYATEKVSISFQYDVYAWEQKFEGEKYKPYIGAATFGLQWLF